MNQTKTWEINGVSLYLDLEDADVMERYENAFTVMKDAETQIPMDAGMAASVRAYCQLFRDLYDRIFGEGTSAKIFAGVPTSAAAYEEVYLQFLTFARDQTIASARHRAERMQKYRPNKAT